MLFFPVRKLTTAEALPEQQILDTGYIIVLFRMQSPYPLIAVCDSMAPEQRHNTDQSSHAWDPATREDQEQGYGDFSGIDLDGFCALPFDPTIHAQETHNQAVLPLITFSSVFSSDL
jgi:hypothetical protein